jgi:hypothetical protein
VCWITGAVVVGYDWSIKDNLNKMMDKRRLNGIRENILFTKEISEASDRVV